MELKDLCGKHIFSGFEAGSISRKKWGRAETVNYVKFCLDGVYYMAVEDPDDGYRSRCEELEISDTECKIKIPNIEVVCVMKESNDYERNDVLTLIDSLTGKEVLSVGTANYDDWYPYCVMQWTPENLSCNANIDSTPNP